MSAFEADRFNRSRTSPRQITSLVVSSLGLPRSRLSASVHRSLDTPGGLVRRKSRLLARPRRLTRAVRTARNDKVKGKANANNQGQSQRLTTLSEKLLQQLRTAARQNATDHFHAMVQSRVVQH